MDERMMTLGRNLDLRWQTVDGWFVSEKFHGCRGYWDGEMLWTRGGNNIKAPKWFTDAFPVGVHLDGEIWCGYDSRAYYRSQLATEHGRFCDEVVFKCFDVPTATGNWAQRMSSCPRNHIIQPVEFGICCETDLPELFGAVKRRNGEGLILRNPEITTYETTRTWNCLKVKTWRQTSRSGQEASRNDSYDAVGVATN